MKPIRIAALVLLALVCAVPLRAADGRTISDVLNQAYDGKTVALQKFYDGQTIEYSSTGDFLKGGNPGPWTLDAYIKIKRVRFKGKELVFEGNRLFFLYSRKRKFNAELGWQVSVAVKVDSASMSVAGIAKVLSKVFMGSNQKLADFVPGYWKPFLLHPNGPYADVCEEFMAQMPPPLGGKSPDLSRACAPAYPIRVSKKGVKPPRPTFFPAPPYTPEARAAKLQGVVTLMIVVGTDGHPRNVTILEPLGMGLDDQAVSTVRTWRFKPSTRHGKPIAAIVTVEVTFRLYLP